MKKLNKLMAAMLALVMCLSLLPMTAFAKPDRPGEWPEWHKCACPECDAWVENEGDYCWKCQWWGCDKDDDGEWEECECPECSTLVWDSDDDDRDDDDFCANCAAKGCTEEVARCKDNPKPPKPEKCDKCDEELDKDGKCPHTEHDYVNGKCTHTGCNETEPTDPDPKPGEHTHKHGKPVDDGNGLTHTSTCPDCPEGTKGKTETEPHEYVNGECVCGAKESTEPTDPEVKRCSKGHVMNYSVIEDATCTKDGRAKWDCSMDGCQETEEVTIKATGHKPEDKVSVVTDTQHTYKCAKCGEAVTVEDHVRGEKIDHKDPTCTEKGYDKYACKHAQNGCTAVETVEINATGHDFTGACVEKDENGHVYLCKNGCGEYGSYVEHDFGAWYAPEGQKATCEKDGVEVRECKDCHCKEQRTVKATGHKDEDPKNDVCDNCGADLSCKHPNKTRNQAEDVAATCQHKGLLAYDCPDCDRTIYEDGAEMLEHSYTGEYRDNENGTHARKCVNGCGEFGGNEAHEFGAWAEQEDGTWTRDCDCGAEETHTHTHGAPVDNGDGTHSSQCTDPNCPDTEDHGRVTEDHVDVNGDGVCDDCGAAIETEIDDTNTPLDEGPEIDDTLIPLASGPITRAEFVNYLWERENKPESTATTFLDVAKDHVYYDAIGWAEANDIAIGVDKEVNFLPDEYVTAGQVRLFLTRYAKYLGMEMPALTTLDGRDDGEAVLNCDEIVAEFFGEEYTTGEPKEDAE